MLAEAEEGEEPCREVAPSASAVASKCSRLTPGWAVTLVKLASSVSAGFGRSACMPATAPTRALINNRSRVVFDRKRLVSPATRLPRSSESRTVPAYAEFDLWWGPDLARLFCRATFLRSLRATLPVYTRTSRVCVRLRTRRGSMACRGGAVSASSERRGAIARSHSSSDSCCWEPARPQPGGLIDACSSVCPLVMTPNTTMASPVVGWKATRPEPPVTVGGVSFTAGANRPFARRSDA